MRSQWSRALLLGGLVAVAAVGFFLSRPGWLLEENSPVRNVIEALSWLSGTAGVVAAGAATSWRWLRAGHSRPDASGAEGLTTPTGLAGRALHLVEGRLPIVSEVSLLELGVKPAMDTDTDADLPPFVRRDADENIEWAISQAGMVLLHGQAASGKSRAALEALRRLRPNHDLLVPCDGVALRELVEAGHAFSRTVIWLDELERYLSAGGLDLGVLHRLSPQQNDIVIAATMRDEMLSRYDFASFAESGEHTGTARAAVELIERLRHRRRVHLNRKLSEKEREEAAGKPDHRILDALRAEEGFAEYLAAGRALFGRWSIGDGELFHLGQALVSAAVDCRRAGYHHPVPVETLETLHHNYLASGWRRRSDLPPITEGIEWACRRVAGASSCLQPRDNGKYIAADYLLDSAENDNSPLVKHTIPAETWNAVLCLTTSQEAFLIGAAAYRYDNKSIADCAFRTGAETGDTACMGHLGLLLEDQGRVDEAESWFRKAVEYGDHIAMDALGDLLEDQGRVNEAESWFRKSVEYDNELAMYSLGALLGEQGRADEAESWLRKAAGHEYTLAMCALGSLLIAQGRVDEAESWLRKAAGNEHRSGMRRLGRFLKEQGRSNEAESWLRKATEYGDHLAMSALGELLKEQGRSDEAESWWRKAVEYGSDLAPEALGVLLMEQGRSDEAESWLREAAEHEDDLAMGSLSVLLEKQGRSDEAESWLRKSIEYDNELAMYSLGALLGEQGRVEEAEFWLRKAVEYGDDLALEALGFLLQEQGRDDEAKAALSARRGECEDK